MAGILVYALHDDEGNFNNNSLGAISEAAKLASEIGGDGYSYALFGGGLLGFEIGAGLTARLNAGVTMEVTAVKAQDGKLVAERPVLQDSAIVDVGYVDEPGIIIGRLNAFDIAAAGRESAEVIDVDVQL